MTRFRKVVFYAGSRCATNGCYRWANWQFAATALAVVLTVWALPRMGYLFLPEIDDGRVSVIVQAEPRTLLDELREQVNRVEAIALVQKEVELVDVSTGGRIGQSVQETPAYAEMLIQLVPKTDRSVSVNEWITTFDNSI